LTVVGYEPINDEMFAQKYEFVESALCTYVEKRELERNYKILGGGYLTDQ